MSYIKSKIFGHNSKMEQTEQLNPGTAFYNFNTPPGITCPGKGNCYDEKWCYALNGFYLYPSVKKKMQKNYEHSQTNHFVDDVVAELQRLQRIQPNKQIYIRWNDAGDIYEDAYFLKLISIAARCPNIRFYSYTKSISIVHHVVDDLGFKIPDNYHVVFSHGGSEDDLIKDDDRQSKIFDKGEEMDEDYVSAWHNDMVAYNNKKVGLPYHGVRKYKP